ncbi:hypothetical protein D4Z77_08870, partial [Campylobacter coli]
FAHTVLHPIIHSANPDQGLTWAWHCSRLWLVGKKQETQGTCSHEADVLVRNYPQFPDEKLRLRWGDGLQGAER